MVTVSGMNVVPVEVRVSASYTGSFGDVPLSVFLTRTAPGGPAGTGVADETLTDLVAQNLPRTSGSPASGVWSGPLLVPSTAAGEFTVTGVRAGDEIVTMPLMTEPTPHAGPTLVVTGLHQPRIRATTSPNPVPLGDSYAIVGEVIDGTTGKPFPTSVAVEIGVDNACAELGRTPIRSTSSGTFTFDLPAKAADVFNCAVLMNGTTYVASDWILVRRPHELWASPSALAARVGTSVPVHGKARHATAYRDGLRGQYCSVELQRLVGDTQWRRAGLLSRVRESGRLTLLAPVTEAGTPIFRVYLPPCFGFVDATSAPFLIRAS